MKIWEIKKQIKEEIENNKKDFTMSFYKVSLETDTYSDLLYFGTDLDKAKLEFNNPSDDSYLNEYRTIVLNEFIFHYKFIGNLEDGETIDDYPIEDYFDDKNIYREISVDEPIEIDAETYDPINKKSHELLSDIEDYYKNKYGKYKYNTINVEDEEGGYLGDIQLRVSDHTENILNNDKHPHDFYVSVVISNLDPTKKRFSQQNSFERRNNEFSYSFDSDDDFEYIIETINELIDELEDFIKQNI